MQESKLVACFVTDDGDESILWEQDFLRDPPVMNALLEQTVLLRLTANSQEAAYLAAIFPLPKTPTLVIIQNGELKEYITSGTSKVEFVNRVDNVLQITRMNERVPSSLLSDAGHISTDSSLQTTRGTDIAESTSSSSSQACGSSNPVIPPDGQAQAPQNSENIVDMERKKQEHSTGKTTSYPENSTTTETQPNDIPATENSTDIEYALIQRKRLQVEREERQRILRRVEDDKIERRERETKRKAEASLENGGENNGALLRSETTSNPQKPQTKLQQCAIQVRLFDGQTIRSRFPTTGSLRMDIRPWIDAQQQDTGGRAYTFKQVLTPLPNKNITISEEEQSLASLGLCPSATLILVPIKGYVTAFESSSIGGLVTGTISTGYSLLSSTFNMVTGLMGGLFRITSSPAQDTSDTVEAHPRIPLGVNVRTLRDQENPPGDQQFYNGNALNFEPRRSSQEYETD
ncbi:hypothetical protein B7463_g8194, partial [Scytalidium lignicola]